jgi:RimJ/RimL family protein N-acetyltransferase
MDDLHVTVEPERIVTWTLILRSWSAEDAQGAFEIYGDPRTAEAIGMRKPVRDLVEMRELLGQWDLQSSQSPVPQGLWAVEAADDGQFLGGATLLPFSPRDPQLVMGWHLRPEVRGRGVAGRLDMLWRTRRFSRATSTRSSSRRRHETREASLSPGV